jgi:hypothetical protein
VWRDERPAYYAAKTEALSLDTELHASGKLAFCSAGSDSGLYFGWFDSDAKKNKTTPDHERPTPHQLGILLEGPSRIGHYFRPSYRTKDASGGAKATGPLLKPDGKLHAWTLSYYPERADGRGQIAVTLDGDEQTFDLAESDRRTGAHFDRFGLFNVQSGGHHIELYLDDVSFTSSAKQ